MCWAASCRLSTHPRTSVFLRCESSDVRRPGHWVLAALLDLSSTATSSGSVGQPRRCRLLSRWAKKHRGRGGMRCRAQVPAPDFVPPFPLQLSPNFLFTGHTPSPLSSASSPKLFALSLPCFRSLQRALLCDPYLSPLKCRHSIRTASHTH